MLLKKNMGGKIKGRGCADGQKQCNTTSKDEASAPTVAIDSVLLLCTIDAKEGLDVATVNIPGDFMHADMDETVHVILEGTIAELLVIMYPKLYWKYIQTERGKPVLYIELLKVLYGTL